MRKVRFGILALCFLTAFAACAPSGAESGSAADGTSEPESSAVSETSAAPESSAVSETSEPESSPAGETTEPESSAEAKEEEFAEGLSTYRQGIEIVLPEKVSAYPFEEHSPGYRQTTGESAGVLRKKLRETNPSFGGGTNPGGVEINFEGSWSCREVRWSEPEGYSFFVPVMLLQAYKKSDIDGGKKVLYETLDHEDIFLKLPKFDLMKYLWKETDEYYIVDFLDVYVADYRLFALEAALKAIDDSGGDYFSEKHPNGMDFDAYMENIKSIRDEIKAGAYINLEPAE